MAKIETRTVDADEAGMRLDRWFNAHYPGLSFGHLQKLIRSGQVRVDGGRVKTSTRVEPGQVVRIPPLRAGEGPVDDRPRASGAGGGAASDDARPAGPARDTGPGASFRLALKAGGNHADIDQLQSMLMHEDDAVFVFNKPPGLAVQGGSGLTRHLDGMLEAMRDRKGQKPRLVHRLDRETSGVIVVARTRLAAQHLAAAFRRRSTRKIYWALVKGVPKPPQGRVSTWLARGEGAEGEKMKVARHGTDDASHAVSLYSVVDKAGQKLAWLTMKPVTGRTHQLRAHAAHIGHPIIGDAKYFTAEDEWDFPGGIQNRLHLHARRLVIPHPAGGTLDVSAPLPLHMQQSWNLLGFDAAMGDADPREDK
ncbi:RluA family pseudouridine synthase [Bauldia litoralis]|uniref:RluA family pseudouridine synthase n=1 Tax=Bauldia litoralis TaxID=665467 RepID=UPI003266EF06